MILESQDPMHEHNKWVPFPQLTKINEIKLKSPLLVQRHNQFSAALLCIANHILLTASNTRLAVDFDECLGDIEILLPTICPGPFLTHVCMASMPLIDRIEDNKDYHQAPESAQDSFFQLSKFHCNVPTKPRQPILLSTRIHFMKLDTHLPMRQNIDDVVQLLCGLHTVIDAVAAP
jgi:hypothetical protein